MKLLFIAVSSFLVALSGALVPGPLFSITIAESARRGSSAGPLIILGHALLELVLVVLLIGGIAPYLTSPLTKTIAGTVGGLVLMYMGYQLLRDARNARLSTAADGPHRKMHPVLSGFLSSLSNPYWIIWWATIGLGYLAGALSFGLPGVVAFFIGHILADLAWYCLLSLAVARGKSLIGDRGYRFLLASCGIFLMLFGAWFAKGIP
ncbi:MAG: LysE family translocator [Alphaproteobacteria bacterium]|uniref:LysE family translocator n=1 Tax=Candidatus Nitrobium versatile TaxID=2884831 RepID=A0A953J7I6_9BACT|nr:LysE family translocator [Candidatus Nitrobium versatile]